MQRREHHRVRLRLPARLRWAAPFAQQTESCVSLDVSRGGLLLRCKHPHAANAPVWVTFPYDASNPNSQPETPARIVRCGRPFEHQDTTRASHQVNDPDAFDVALCFAPTPHAAQNGNGKLYAAERRCRPRHPVSLPLRVRPESMPWFEETMTLDASSDSLRFLSNREYAPSGELLVSFDAKSQAPWPGGIEIRSQIVRVETLPGKAALAVVVHRLR